MDQQAVRTAGHPAGGFGPRQIAGAVITLAVLALIVVEVLPRFADYRQAWSSLQQMTAPWVLAVAVTAVANLVVYVWPFQAALPGLTFRHGFAVRQTSFAISNGVPAGGAIGLGVQYRMLTDHGYGQGPASAAVGISSVWNVLVTLGLPAVAAVAAVVSGRITTHLVVAAVVGMLVLVTAVSLLALVLGSDRAARMLGRQANRVLAWLARLTHRPAAPHADHALAAFRSSTVDVVRARWPLLTLTNVLLQLVQVAILYVTLRGLAGSGTPVGVLDVFVAFSFARLASFVPVTPGGLGTVDAALTALLVAAGASGGTALAAAVVWRAASFVPQVVAGIITFLAWRHRSPAPVTRSPGDASARVGDEPAT